MFRFQLFLSGGSLGGIQTLKQIRVPIQHTVCAVSAVTTHLRFFEVERLIESMDYRILFATIGPESLEITVGNSRTGDRSGVLSWIWLLDNSRDPSRWNDVTHQVIVPHTG